jgi:hypothetical protein
MEVKFMKLNFDCIRDVLLALEESLTIEAEVYDLGEGEETSYSFSFISIDQLLKHERLKEYSNMDIFYSVNKLSEIGYIEAECESGDNMSTYLISDIKYPGHEFLQSIKSETVWNDVKNVSKKVGSLSFPIISSIAGSIITKIISTSMGIATP